MQTLYILWLRQLKKYLRSKSRIIGSLGQPLLFLITFGIGFGSVFQKAGQGSYIQYLAPGIILMSVVFTAIFSGVELIWDRQFGFLKETLVAPVSRLNIVLGKVLGGATVALIQGFVVFILTLILGFEVKNYFLLPLAILFALLVAMLFTGLGIVIASKMEDMQGFQLVMNFLVMPIVFLSGAFFPLEGLPKAMAWVVRFDPLTYGVDGLRGSLIGVSTFGLHLDLVIVLVVTFLLLIIGSKLFERIQV